MNKDIMKALGFGEEVALVEKGICPECKVKVDISKLMEQTSPLYYKEFKISGLCVECQDGVFENPEEDYIFNQGEEV